MLRHTVTLLWRALAVFSIVLAVIGAVLPVMPTVPFLLMAAWAAGKGWPALEAWMLGHRSMGPVIRRWRTRRAVPRRAKWLATGMMSCSALFMQFSPLPPAVRLGVPAVMALVLLWLWRQPDQ
jgi:uncharacterized membrane protein YbaN (DUF454 family)